MPEAKNDFTGIVRIHCVVLGKLRVADDMDLKLTMDILHEKDHGQEQDRGFVVSEQLQRGEVNVLNKSATSTVSVITPVLVEDVAKKSEH